ncbi:MAG TPA: magnesium transporter MgtC [Clostridiales bacterium]|nr:magnesium transporter MgtC [Clostridiales bacterium]
MASFNAVIEHLHEVNLVSMLVRFAIALLGGGIIGMSRGKRQHAAGLRTHLLVCIGAASVMMTSLYQAQNLGVPGDAFRMPAQVVSGVGFLGAGSILVTGKRHVTGLTTAAGLWASACMGLAAGAGFYEGALLCTVLSVIAISVLYRLENLLGSKTAVIEIYIELKDVDQTNHVVSLLSTEEYKVYKMQITPSRSGLANNIGIEALLRLDKTESKSEALNKISSLPEVAFALETV